MIDIYYFIIKLNKSGRWSEFLKTVSEWYKVNIKWIFWKFELNYNYPIKVFIAIWTWIAPIVSMVEQLWDVSDCCLLFWVRSFDELFYEDWIKSKNFKDVKIFLSKEKRDWYEYWRLDLSLLRKYSKNTEFYICWNPSMVEEKVKELEEMWFTNIYFEKFI